MRFFILLLFLLSSQALKAQENSLNVLVSLKPLHSLVAGVMKSRGTPALLMSGGESPHTYALRPKDLEKIQRADVIFWIGPTLEEFLRKPLKTVGPKAIALIETQGLSLIPRRFSHEAHEDSHSHTHEGIYDAHIWLDPSEAVLLVKAVADKLGALDPEGREIYEKNAVHLTQQLQKLLVDLQKELKDVSDMGFFVFHDAYAYFERAFHLKNKGTLTINPEITPSLKKMKGFKEKIERENIKCIFSEPQFPSGIVDLLKNSTEVRTGLLDPLGIDLPPGEEAYFNLIRKLAHNFKRCLSS